jgi:hypothetical protein
MSRGREQRRRRLRRLQAKDLCLCGHPKDLHFTSLGILGCWVPVLRGNQVFCDCLKFREPFEVVR